MKQIQDIVMLLCAVGAILLAVMFFNRPAPIQVTMKKITPEILEENKAQIQQEAKRQQAEQAARKRAEMEKRVHKCSSDDDCIIVDKDSCGCLRGPKSVTAINSEYSLEFSKLIEQKNGKIEVCKESLADADMFAVITTKRLVDEEIIITSMPQHSFQNFFHPLCLRRVQRVELM